MSDRPAPGRIQELIEFVNTRDDDEGTDALGTVAEAEAWLAGSGLAGDVGTPTAAELERLVAVREALRPMLFANTHGEPAPTAALELLSAEGARSPLGLRFGPGGVEAVAAGTGVDAAVADLLSIVGDAMRRGEWSRVKGCGAEDCIWAFYDHSRNRSATWCRMEECGNREKARAYRARRRAEAAR